MEKSRKIQSHQKPICGDHVIAKTALRGGSGSVAAIRNLPPLCFFPSAHGPQFASAVVI